MNFKKILITGGAGTLGKNLTKFFLKENCQVCIVDNFSTSKKISSKEKDLVVFEGSIADKFFLDKVFSKFKPEIIFNSAASYKDPLNWVEDINTNILGAVNISELSSKYNIKKIINFQTALCYGKVIKSPITLDQANNPNTSYSISKTAGESYLLNTFENIVSLRIANICSPYLSIGPIPTFYKRLKNNDQCFCTKAVRDFLDIDDFLDLIKSILEKPSINGVFNVSTGKGSSIFEIYQYISKFLGKNSQEIKIKEIQNDDIEELVLDPKETEDKFGWVAKRGLEEMLNKQLDWYEKNGISTIYSHLSNK
ncbi:NAD-dependent epimerase/dehydratase family protein [Prochlorococcus marinus XMU1419]|uniref:NAD-dependent epimerase/dehydratase family protein n=1 Tax=Prochlorococcus marinus TaxID=1219 RepID=UPI001ADBF6D2|nr:NAD-dependent epimerase/dehydratase family protein [Prochlorococcus marinus]MBO8234257.1 NAD-dependent epimerase/dehydratase family protein [Prochlorococcus marinus XMU1419]MBW3075947.1 nucleotide sugar epimerase [Prochlorococcus marinus str. XMU1419]